MSKANGGGAPDNNKRLAALEAGVSILAIALTANGVTVPDGADPFELAIGRVKHAAELDSRLMALIAATTGVVARFGPDLELAPQNEAEALIDVQIRLLEQLAGHETPCDRKIHELEQQLAAGPTGATEGEIAAIARAEKAEGELLAAQEEIGELKTDVDDAMSEKNRLANELTAALEGRPHVDPGAGDAEPEEAPPAAVERVRPETARDVGAEYPGIHSSADIAALLAGGDVEGLELVFSNGAYEILTLQPVAISPKDLQPAEGRNMVVPAVFAKLLASDPQEELAGVGLMLQGEQIAYCAFPDRLTLHPGGERRFERTIFF